jgi:RimJ/RimL family protein N-acetyltransferase
MTGQGTAATPHGELVIRRALPEDLDALLALSDDVDAWLRSRGISPGVPPRPMSDIFAERTARGVQYVGTMDDEVAGTIVLEWADDGVWADAPNDACYVHGFAVRRAYAGIGLVLLRWAEHKTAARGKLLLRLDCMMENLALRVYYERAGFTHRGDVRLPHRGAARYEKVVSAPGAL